MITQVSSLYPVKALNETREKTDSHFGGDRTSNFPSPPSLSLTYEQGAQANGTPFSIVVLDDISCNSIIFSQCIA